MFQFSDGLGAVNLFVYFDRHYSVSEELGLLKATSYMKSVPVDVIQSETQFSY